MHTPGYDYGERVPLTEWEHDLSKDEEMLLTKLQGGRHDYALLDMFVAPVLAEKLGIQVKMLSPLVDASPLSLGLNTKHTALAREYEHIMTLFNEASLNSGHFPKDLSKKVKN